MKGQTIRFFEEAEFQGTEHSDTSALITHVRIDPKGPWHALETPFVMTAEPYSELEFMLEVLRRGA